MDDVIQVEGLCKSYGGLCALRDFSLSVGRGSVFGLLGANGAGKSTAIECILGTKRPDAGTVRILGMDPLSRRRQLFARVGVQFQQANYQEKIKVGELCAVTACLYRDPSDWRGLLARFGLAGREGALVQELSGGQRQRLFIVLALLPKPEAVFLDELTTGLDPRARREVWGALSELKDQGLSILLSSHFMDEVEALCDRICILRRGRAVFSGTVAQAVDASPFARFEDAYLWYTEEEKDESLLHNAQN